MKPTPQQRAIIDFPLEPLRVTAGAGTGKTTTMAWRLAQKVTSGEVDPEQTLGITFTNKAAGELTERIRVHLGAAVGEGRDVEVTTYHGFAYGLIREFGPLIGVSRSVRLVTPGYVRQLLRDALGSESREFLDLTQTGTVVDRLLALSSTLGDHLRQAADLDGAGVEELIPARREIGAILAEFNRRKRELGVVDFADLVTAAHEIVTTHLEVADRIRSRYRLVLLDEYQDTNPGQRELLLTLFGGGFPVTAVGDSDQTIYEWRGASPQNFERFPEHFAHSDGTPAASLELATSWRSGTSIVELANTVRREISTPGPLPVLLARQDAPPAKIWSHWLHSSVAEARWIADQVLRIHIEQERPWREIAVLFRKHRQMATIRDALVSAGVPVEVASMGGLLDVPEVTDLHAWLRILGRPDDAPALMRILLGSRFRLGMGDLAPLAGWVRRQRRDASDEASIGWALLEAADSLDEVEGLATEPERRLRSFREEYRTLLAAAQGVSLVELCRQVLDHTRAWQEIEALPDAARLSARLNIHRFLDLAEDWSPLEGGPSLDAFLDHLEVLADDSASSELDTARVSGEDAVAMLTVHRAKGLEWPVVFLPALVTGTFPSRIFRYEDPFTRADVLPHELRLDQDSLPDLSGDESERKAALRVAHADGEWRTAYVAVTRAAHTVLASGAWWYTDGKSRTPSRLFEIIDGLAEPATGRVTEAGDPPASLRLEVDSGTVPDPHFVDGHIAALRTTISDRKYPSRLAAEAGITAQYDAAVDQLGMQLDGLPAPLETPAADDRFRTSVTGLVTYASCGLRFRWAHVDRLPRRPSPAARRGVALHRKIELHHRGTVAFDDAAPDFYDEPTGDEAPSRPVESSFERFTSSRFAVARPILIEAPFELSIGESAVSGRIDAIYEPEPGSWEIVDFKSGRPSTQPSRKVQLEAYAVASQTGLAGFESPDNITVTFAYFGGDEVVAESESVDKAWLSAAADHLETLVAGAAAGPYDAEPGESCRFCDFSRFCEAGTDWLESNY
jgi:DNA helicase-2/ATP-dependent DNA helicase PcrA